MLAIIINVNCLCTGKNVVAYYDAQNSTIRHEQCAWKIPANSFKKRCHICKTYRDNVLRTGISKLLKQNEDDERASKLCSIKSCQLPILEHSRENLTDT